MTGRLFKYFIFPALIFSVFCTSKVSADTTFPYNQPGIYITGVYAINGGYVTSGGGGRIDMRVTGTDASLASIITDQSTVTVTVDGVTSSKAVTGSTLTLFTGLSDAPHNVTVDFISAGYLWISQTNFVSVTGSAPTISATTLTDVAPQYFVGSYTTAITHDGTMDYGGGGALRAIATDASFRFKVTSGTTQVKAYVAQYIDGTLAVSVDGALPTFVSFSNTGTWNLLTLVNGLDGNPHEIRVSVVAGGAGPYIHSIMPFGGNLDTVNTPQTIPLWVFYGDSITQDYGLTDGSFGFPYKIGRQLNVAVLNRGFSGSVVKTAACAGGISGQSGETRTADITNANPTPAQVVILYGSNDQGQSCGAESISAFQASYLNMITQISAGLPSTKILNLGLLDAVGRADTPQWRTAIQNANTSLGSSNSTYLETAGIISTSTDLIDNVHPNSSGATKIANAIIAAVNPPALGGRGTLYTQSSAGGDSSINDAWFQDYLRRNGLATSTDSSTTATSTATTTDSTTAISRTVICPIGYTFNTMTGQRCTTYSTTTATPAPSFATNLSLSMTHPDVVRFQQYLNSHGFAISSTGAGSIGKESNYFGAKTKAALSRFQAANKISPAIGYFGPLTRAYVNTH